VRADRVRWVEATADRRQAAFGVPERYGKRLDRVKLLSEAECDSLAAAAKRLHQPDRVVRLYEALARIAVSRRVYDLAAAQLVYGGLPTTGQRDAVRDANEALGRELPAARALLEAHVEPEVVEVYGEAARTWAESRGRALSNRLEIAGETAFCYATDAAPLLADLATHAGVRYLHRPANLEDLFIKLTGRELRD
jgi:hypothetical protein